MAQRKVVRKLYDGRVLLSSPLGDQYWITELNGQNRLLSIQEAIKLSAERAAPEDLVVRVAKVPKRKPTSAPAAKNQRDRRTKPLLTLNRRDIEDAAQYCLTRDPNRHGEFREFKGDLSSAIQQKADEIQDLLANAKGSRHSREFSAIFYRGLAKLWRGHMKEKAAEPA